MDVLQEAVVASDSVNCSIYDLQTGSPLGSFNEGNTAKKCLSFIKRDCIISANYNQRGLKVWTLDSKSETLKMKMSGIVTALGVSNCGDYCAVGIDKVICAWEVRTGLLLSTSEYHSQQITCIRFSSDGSHLITSGKDGMVLVWLLSEIISTVEESKPRYVWMHHAAEVTDICVGNLAMYSRVVTASKDLTCNIYELETGNHLVRVHVGSIITAIAMDNCEYFLLLGSAEGDIYRINLFSVNSRELHYESSDKNSTFVGHSKEITCLSVSATGKFLVSGSEDCKWRVWDMHNFQCIRVHKCEGPVTNIAITLMPPGLKKPDYIMNFIVQPFKNQSETASSSKELGNNLYAYLQHRKLSLMHVGSPDEYFDSRVLNISEESLKALHRKNSISADKLSRINAQLYSYALCETISQIPEDSELFMDSD